MERTALLRVLSICYSVYAVVSAVGALAVTAFVAFAASFVFAGSPPRDAAALGLALPFLWMFVAVAVLFGLAQAALFAAAGRALDRRRSFTLCLVAACLVLPSAPLGTVLGILTLVQLYDAETRREFEAEAARSAAAR